MYELYITPVLWSWILAGTGTWTSLVIVTFNDCIDIIWIFCHFCCLNILGVYQWIKNYLWSCMYYSWSMFSLLCGCVERNAKKLLAFISYTVTALCLYVFYLCTHLDDLAWDHRVRLYDPTYRIYISLLVCSVVCCKMDFILSWLLHPLQILNNHAFLWHCNFASWQHFQ